LEAETTSPSFRLSKLAQHGYVRRFLAASSFRILRAWDLDFVLIRTCSPATTSSTPGGRTFSASALAVIT